MAQRTDAVTRQIRHVRKAIRDLNRAVAQLAAALNGRPPGEPPEPTSELTPKRLAQLKLHGAYIGHLRHLKPRQRAEVKAVKAKKGYEAAIRAARTISSR